MSLLGKGNEEPRSCWSGEVNQGPTNSSEATNVRGPGEDEQGRYLMHRHPVPMLSLAPSISLVWAFSHFSLSASTEWSLLLYQVCVHCSWWTLDLWAAQDRRCGQVLDQRKNCWVGCLQPVQAVSFMCIYVYTLEANIYCWAGDKKINCPKMKTVQVVYVRLGSASLIVVFSDSCVFDVNMYTWEFEMRYRCHSRPNGARANVGWLFSGVLLCSLCHWRQLCLWNCW